MRVYKENGSNAKTSKKRTIETAQCIIPSLSLSAQSMSLLVSRSCNPFASPFAQMSARLSEVSTYFTDTQSHESRWFSVVDGAGVKFLQGKGCRARRMMTEMMTERDSLSLA